VMLDIEFEFLVVVRVVVYDGLFGVHPGCSAAAISLCVSACV
jgi:hypothetical protein